MTNSSAEPIDVMLVYGTRPEAIKMAPLVHALNHDARFRPIVAVTGQHREMLDQVHNFFGIAADVDLDIHSPGQTLTQVTTRTLEGVGRVIEDRRPDAVFVQGDTTSAFAAALAGFYHELPVVHVEAGLRTGDIWSPFPEEGNRRLIGQLTALHLPPRPASKENLLREDFASETIHVTGNTVIDALLDAVKRYVPSGDAALDAVVSDPSRRLVLVTAHRRESWGAPMERIGEAVARLAREHPDVVFALPVHRNPKVREALLPHVSVLSNVIVTEPLAYGAFCTVMNRADIVLTDSGGVQEEAPALSKPVLVLRENTERPEAVEFGVARLVGTDSDRIFAEASRLLDDADAYAAMAHAVNPYGDGRACQRVLAATAELFGRGEAVADFDPARQ